MLLIAIIPLVMRPRKLPIRRRLLRAARKHQTALAALLLFHFVFFFPTLFMGRLLSPNDILYNYTPWSIDTPLQSQNGTFNDIPTSYLTLMTLMQRDYPAFHWNRYIASGVPGFGSAGAAVLSPFVVIPVLLLPIALVYSGIIFLKLNAGFLFAYLWLREERNGKESGRNRCHGRRRGGNHRRLVALATDQRSGTLSVDALCDFETDPPRRDLVSAGDADRSVFRTVGIPGNHCVRRIPGGGLGGLPDRPAAPVPVRGIARALCALAIAAGLASPSVASFAKFLVRTGYLQARSNASFDVTYPAPELANFIHPFRLGDPVAHAWYGDPALGASNNFLETTLFLGFVPLLLSVAGLLRRRSAARWFWAAFALILVLAMFGWSPVARVAGGLPGIKYSPLARLRFSCLPPSRIWRLPALRFCYERSSSGQSGSEIAAFALRPWSWRWSWPASWPGSTPTSTRTSSLHTRRCRREKPFAIFSAIEGRSVSLPLLLPHTQHLGDVRTGRHPQPFQLRASVPPRFLQRIDAGSFGESARSSSSTGSASMPTIRFCAC